MDAVAPLVADVLNHNTWFTTCNRECNALLHKAALLATEQALIKQWSSSYHIVALLAVLFEPTHTFDHWFDINPSNDAKPSLGAVVDEITNFLRQQVFGFDQNPDSVWSICRKEDDHSVLVRQQLKSLVDTVNPMKSLPKWDASEKCRHCGLDSFLIMHSERHGSADEPEKVYYMCNNPSHGMKSAK